MYCMFCLRRTPASSFPPHTLEYFFFRGKTHNSRREKRRKIPKHKPLSLPLFLFRKRFACLTPVCFLPFPLFFLSFFPALPFPPQKKWITARMHISSYVHCTQKARTCVDAAFIHFPAKKMRKERENKFSRNGLPVWGFVVCRRLVCVCVCKQRFFFLLFSSLHHLWAEEEERDGGKHANLNNFPLASLLCGKSEDVPTRKFQLCLLYYPWTILPNKTLRKQTILF